MVVVRILGGLGNQMFQYAYARSLSLKGYDVKLDISKFKTYKLHGGYQLNKFNIKLKKADPLAVLYGKIGLKSNIKEKSLLFNGDFKSLKGNEYVKGYFQTEKYFNKIRETLLNDFVINQKLSINTQKMEQQILSTKNSCSLHIRRGDYISDEKANKIHGTCNLDYYHKAIEIINKKYTNTTFYIFSDDISWTKKNLKTEKIVFVDVKSIPHEDMYLMSLCNHNITANSSFSWWGAWLNTNKNKIVIAPRNWFIEKENEVACENWIKL
ncbi:alpha-1,2-fucosyltransferase [Polaribacter aquimarinus]|uniref:Alpha-1,2-fucosyltransferase n=2 Tax=Polaribacter aquimarinus TaxID=2100726 RepID=A0A2U2JAQ8_9FLAO|nr:alpha-1,2-fucosyltransferase [Polaribacter aquimarinus]